MEGIICEDHDDFVFLEIITCEVRIGETYVNLRKKPKEQRI